MDHMIESGLDMQHSQAFYCPGFLWRKYEYGKAFA